MRRKAAGTLRVDATAAPRIRAAPPTRAATRCWRSPGRRSTSPSSMTPTAQTAQRRAHGDALGRGVQRRACRRRADLRHAARRSWRRSSRCCAAVPAELDGVAMRPAMARVGPGWIAEATPRAARTRRRADRPPDRRRPARRRQRRQPLRRHDPADRRRPRPARRRRPHPSGVRARAALRSAPRSRWRSRSRRSCLSLSERFAGSARPTCDPSWGEQDGSSHTDQAQRPPTRARSDPARGARAVGRDRRPDVVRRADQRDRLERPGHRRNPTRGTSAASGRSSPRRSSTRACRT